MKKLIEAIKFRLKCLQAEILFWTMDIRGMMNQINSRRRK
jgi:hypothetical protein